MTYFCSAVYANIYYCIYMKIITNCSLTVQQLLTQVIKSGKYKIMNQG